MEEGNHSHWKSSSPFCNYNPIDKVVSIPHIISKIFLYLDPHSFLSCRLVCKEWNSNVEMVYPKHQDTYFIVTGNGLYIRHTPSHPTFLTKRLSFLNTSHFSYLESFTSFLTGWGENAEAIHMTLNSTTESGINAMETVAGGQFYPKLKEFSLTISTVYSFDPKLEQALGIVSNVLKHLKIVDGNCFTLNMPVLPVLKSLTLFPTSFERLKLDYENYGGFVGFLKGKFPNLSTLVLINEESEDLPPNYNYILASEIVRSRETHESLKVLVIPKPNSEKYIAKIKEKFPNLKRLKIVNKRSPYLKSLDMAAKKKDKVVN